MALSDTVITLARMKVCFSHLYSKFLIHIIHVLLVDVKRGLPTEEGISV